MTRSNPTKGKYCYVAENDFDAKVGNIVLFVLIKKSPLCEDWVIWSTGPIQMKVPPRSGKKLIWHYSSIF